MDGTGVEDEEAPERQLKQVVPFCYYAPINKMAPNEDQEPTAGGRISESLLALLACPACRASLDQQEGMLRCRGCGRGFPIRDGVPVMLLDEAVAPADDSCGTSGTT
jgi:uncharacterized protein YbaR (Trm112 family)